MKDKDGNKITSKEFFQRWKEGIQKVTPLQTTKLSIIGIAIVLVGICIGIYTAIATRTWWLLIIFIGSIILSGLNALGTLQKYWQLKMIDKIMKGGIENVKESTD